MLHPLIVLFAEEALDAVFVFEVKVAENRITFHNFIQDIKVQRQFIYTFYLLHQLSTDRTPYPPIVSEYLQAFSTECMSAVDQYARNTLSNVEVLITEVAKV